MIKRTRGTDSRNKTVDIATVEVEVKKAVPWDDQNNISRNPRGNSISPGRTKKIFVGGLPSTITESDFKKYIDQFVLITDVVVMYDHHTQRPRGFGFITFGLYRVSSEEVTECLGVIYLCRVTLCIHKDSSYSERQQEEASMRFFYPFELKTFQIGVTALLILRKSRIAGWLNTRKLYHISLVIRRYLWMLTTTSHLPFAHVVYRQGLFIAHISDFFTLSTSFFPVITSD
ncbi:hypothetical protein MLD38_036814 [Melastoma candidum]|uniref:Uncharacterized protein n=1 Tax=Melastoma candidum TaxID=119954 RepID=A0ACB9LM13_9MYRT|nr:hypothetical protein MLD38_036814 [Melastoma candidum]